MTAKAARLRAVAAALCVLLCAVLSVQFVVTAIDSAEHAFHFHHDPGFGVAGLLQVDIADAHLDDLDAGHGPEYPPHRHHGGEHQLATLQALSWTGVIQNSSRYRFFLPQVHSWSATGTGLERPPKPRAEHSV